MFEAHDVTGLWIPSFCEFHGTRGGIEADSVWSELFFVRILSIKEINLYTYNSHSHVEGLTSPITLASASLNLFSLNFSIFTGIFLLLS